MVDRRWQRPLPAALRPHQHDNDGGTQAMDMQFTAADAANIGTVLTTVNALSGSTQGVDFPSGAYWQATFRVLPNGINNNPFGDLTAAWWTWSDTAQSGRSSSFTEYDFLEEYASGCCHNDAGLHPWGAVPPGQSQLILAGFGRPEFKIDPTIYHTIAGRITQDGSTNLALCIYIDGVLQVCGDYISSGSTTPTPAQFNQRNYAVLQVGPLNSTPVTQPMDMLIKDVQIWTCPGWQGPLNQPRHPCNGPVLTGAP
jgi:hypothetical protein